MAHTIALGTPLTTRELQVARLVAQKMTNTQIAEKLDRSVRTVESHLWRSYRKTGTSNRIELVSWLTEKGI